MLLKNPPGGMVTAFIIRLELGFCLIELFFDQFNTDILFSYEKKMTQVNIYVPIELRITPPGLERRKEDPFLLW